MRFSKKSVVIISKGSEKSTLEIHVVNKGISLCNLGLCLLYLGMTVLSELAATQATSDFIFMTSYRRGG